MFLKNSAYYIFDDDVFATINESDSDICLFTKYFLVEISEVNDLFQSVNF